MKKLSLILCCFLGVLLIPMIMADSQTRSVSESITATWLYPDRAHDSDDSCTIQSFSDQYLTQSFLNDNFTIPEGANITGIEIHLEFGQEDDNDYLTLFIKDANMDWYSVDLDNKEVGTCAGATVSTFGNSTYLWEGVYNVSHVNNGGDTGFRISVMTNNIGASRDHFVDHINVTVHYTPVISTYNLTTYFHTGIDQLLVNGSSKINGTQTTFNPNEIANITAIAASGYIFLNYNGSIIDNPYYLTMDQDYEIHAYALKTYNLTVYLHTGISQLLLNGSSKSNGTLTTYNISQVANITAIADSGYIFDDYNGSITDNPYYLTMDQDYEIHAYANVSDVSTLEILSDMDSLFSSQVLTLTGNHTDGSIGISGSTLTFQRSSDNVSWTNILNQTTDSLGYSQIGYAQDEAGTWYFRVHYPGDSYSAKNSSSIEIDFRQISGEELEGLVPGPPPKEEPPAIEDLFIIPSMDPNIINFIMIVILSFIILLSGIRVINLKEQYQKLISERSFNN